MRRYADAYYVEERYNTYPNVSQQLRNLHMTVIRWTAQLWMPFHESILLPRGKCSNGDHNDHDQLQADEPGFGRVFIRSRHA